MRFLLPPVLLVAAVAVSACTGTTTPSAEGTDDNSSIVLADATEPTTLNPLLGYGPEGVSKIFDGLVEHRADRTLRPQLAAEAPKPAADGLSWTVKLRDDVKFTDGSAFGAEDVVATYRALLDPAAGATVRPEFAMLTGVEQLDVRNVRFTLSQPYAPFPDLLVLGILPSEALAAGGPLANSPVNTAPVGTGPYKLEAFNRGQDIVLVANPDYWGGAPSIDKVTYRFVGESGTRLSGLVAGEFDVITNLLPEFVESVPKSAAVQG
ncbi:MAG: ABC transporter substrate-binding protein, partial [Umezawaea sp.]